MRGPVDPQAGPQPVACRRIVGGEHRYRSADAFAFACGLDWENIRVCKNKDKECDQSEASVVERTKTGLRTDPVLGGGQGDVCTLSSAVPERWMSTHWIAV